MNPEAMSSFNTWDLVSNAGPVVKLVMLMLLLSSVVSWAVIVDKWRRFRKINEEAIAFEERFWSGANIADLFQTALRTWPASPLPTVFMAGYREWSRWGGGEEGRRSLLEFEVGDVIANVRRAMVVSMNREVENLERGLTFLATVGSTSPFIGLFGTVWGIMNAFIGLSGAKSSTIAMVAPGIAEALIATAMGLVAAIPAVIAYNKYSADLRHLHQQMDNFGAEFINILERRTVRFKGGEM